MDFMNRDKQHHLYVCLHRHKISQTLDHRTLQREATQRLNEFADILRNSTNASLSAKNLGDEGAAYVVEGLAFNDR